MDSTSGTPSSCVTTSSGSSGPGDDRQTGRDDLREGKRTVLVAHTLTGASAAGRGRVEELLGRADLAQEHVEDLRAIITESGAVTAVEAEISRLAEQSLAALGRATGVAADARAVLADLVEISTARTA
jgi:geranylgeranyl diphosphate synthase type I